MEIRRQLPGVSSLLPSCELPRWTVLVASPFTHWAASLAHLVPVFREIGNGEFFLEISPVHFTDHQVPEFMQLLSYSGIGRFCEAPSSAWWWPWTAMGRMRSYPGKHKREWVEGEKHATKWRGEKRDRFEGLVVQLPTVRWNQSARDTDHRWRSQPGRMEPGVNQRGKQQTAFLNDTGTSYQGSRHFPSPSFSIWLTRIWLKAIVPLDTSSTFWKTKMSAKKKGRTSQYLRVYLLKIFCLYRYKAQ